MLSLLATGTMLAGGGNITIKASWDSTNVLLMGKTMPLRIEIVQPGDASGTLLTTSLDTLTNGVEVVRALKADTIDLHNNRIQINQALLVQAFDSGLYQLPPVIYLTQGDTLLSNRLTLKVIPLKVDTAGPIADFKPVLGIKRKTGDYIPDFITRLWWLWLLLAALAAAGIYIWRSYKKRGVAPWVPLKKRLPPYEEAMLNLERVEKSSLWQQGLEKDYHTAVTDVLRVYIERRFEVSAVELTSAEIMDELRTLDSIEEKAVLSKLNEVLNAADLVKFADDHPGADVNVRSLMLARDFVESTKPKPVIAEQDEADKKQGKEVEKK